MGEYASFRGERIKIGTCEEMYYLRADQVRLLSGSDIADHGLKVHRNGFAGAVGLVQQRLVDGQLLPILSCVCGMAWRVAEEDSGPLFEALDAASQAERHRESLSYRHWEDHELPEDWQSMYDDLADRVRQGFDREYVAGLFGGR